MYLGTAITGVLFAAACTLPIVINNRNRSKKFKHFFDKLRDLATRYNAQIDTHDVWNETAIGVDKIKMKLFYMQTNGESQIEREVDIKNVLQCRLEKKSRIFDSNGESNKIIERLDLYFVFIDKKLPDLLLAFYDNKRDNLSVDREFELVNKWSVLVNDLLKEHSTKSQRHF